MGSIRTFYDMVSVSPEATMAEIERAYDQLIKGSEDKGEFHLIDAAFDEISQESTRSLYDMVLLESDEFIKVYHEYIWSRDNGENSAALRVSLLKQMITSMTKDLYQLYAELANTQMESAAYADALQNYDRYLEKVPHDLEVMTDKAMALCKTRQFDDAEIVIREVLKSNPNSISALQDFPLCLRELGQKEIANDFLEREIAAPVDREEETLCNLLKNRIIFCFEDGEQEKGHNLFREFMTILKNMGNLLHSSYLYESLLTTLEEAGEQKLYKELAATLNFTTTHTENMEDMLRKEYQKNPHSIDAILPLVEYLRLHSKKEDAQAIIAFALESKETALDKHLLHLIMQKAMFHLEDGEQIVAYEVLDKALLSAEKEAVQRADYVIKIVKEVIEDLQQFGEHHWVQKFQNLKDELTKTDDEVVKVATREGCYIATAVYGSYKHPQVMKLRRFRDTFLASSPFGRACIRYYYAFSPILARRLGNNSVMSQLTRYILNICIKLFKFE